ncbi:MAG: zinc ribbon domain-containing protein [Candidatus Methanoperedens sp.]|nr:zinc ribbon domain-containing protein [Candidatus Methanoperedens sp.]
MTKFVTFVATLLILLSPGTANAQQTVVNSADWVDVYSSVMYSNLEKTPYYFTISETHARELPQYINKGLDIRLVESDTVPYLAGYKGTLESSGYRVTEVIKSAGGRKLNLELAKRLDVNKFIVMDDEYGYNAISVAPYAVRSGSWVLFADRDNIDEVYGFLSGRKVENVLIYGRVDRSVSERLGGFNPEKINNGNRFDDNIAIIKKYMELSPSKDIILTNGDFIEATLMSGEYPVMFTGVDTVPPRAVEYLKGSEIKYATLLGNDLTGAAKELKDETGIRVMIKFGQGRKTTGGTALVEELDKFYLPRYELTLDIIKAQYNEATKQLEIIYRNDAKMGEFLKSSAGIFADGQRVLTVGDEAVRYIDAESESGIAYNADLTDYARRSNITVQVSAEFGEAEGSLNLLLKKELGVSIISVQDSSEIKVSDLRYDTGTQRIKLTVENTGKVPVYASPSVTLLIGGKEEVVRLGNALPAAAGERSEASGRVELTSADLADNPQAKVHVAYGERPNLLIKSLDNTMPLKKSGDRTAIMIALASAVVLSGAVIWHRSRNNSKDIPCANCGEGLPGDAKFCPRCGKEAP